MRRACAATSCRPASSCGHASDVRTGSSRETSRPELLVDELELIERLQAGATDHEQAAARDAVGVTLAEDRVGVVVGPGQPAQEALVAVAGLVVGQLVEQVVDDAHGLRQVRDGDGQVARRRPQSGDRRPRVARERAQLVADDRRRRAQERPRRSAAPGRARGPSGAARRASGRASSASVSALARPVFGRLAACRAARASASRRRASWLAKDLKTASDEPTSEVSSLSLPASAFESLLKLLDRPLDRVVALGQLLGDRAARRGWSGRSA